MATKHSVIACTVDGTLYIWDIPTNMPPLSATSAIPLISNDPKEVIVLARSPKQQLTVRSLVCTTHWQQRLSKYDDYFCLFTEVDRKKQLRSFFVRRAEAPQEGHSPSSRRVFEGGRWWNEYQAPKPDLFSSSISPLYRIGDNLVLCTASAAKAAVVTVFPRPSQASESRMKTTSREITLPGSIRVPRETFLEIRSGFCPMSARLVYLSDSKQISTGTRKLLVSDYLVPPPEDL